MGELLTKLNSHDTLAALIILVPTLGGLLVGAISIVATQWRRVRLAELEASLKQQMLERGMSAAEIDQVMGASCNPTDAKAGLWDTKDHVRAAMVRTMVKEGMPVEDIERVLKAMPARNHCG